MVTRPGVAVDERAIGERYWLLNAQGVLDQRTRRLWAAAEARSAGYGGIAAVVRATGISESTAPRGWRTWTLRSWPAPGNVRRHSGRTPILEREPGLEEDLERAGGSGHQGGSGVAVAVDVEERREARRGATGHGP